MQSHTFPADVCICVVVVYNVSDGGLAQSTSNSGPVVFIFISF